MRLDSGAERTVITVPFRRRPLLWIVLLGWPLTPVAFAAAIYLRVIGIESQLPMIVLGSLPMVAIFSTVLLVLKVGLSYDLRQRQLSSPNGPIKWRYGDRIEYSIYRGRLELIRANGKRRGLTQNSWALDQDSWTEFVDVYLSHQNEWKRATDYAAAPAAPPKQAGSLIEVGIRWRFFTWVLVAGLVYAVLNYLFWLDTTENYSPYGPMAVIAVGCFLFGTVPLVLRPVLRYEDGRVSINTVGRAAREFPSKGYERLENSVYWGCLFEVRADGKRRRVARGWARDQDSWKVFVDRFMEDRSSE
ncbi:MAG: hypothetical protein HOQ43_11250 [Glycomyces artemisiae]|uniref:Uncharacterized protein n=1 Tax=Glycomyces artemisiae TaxID=1076443 RepID=A0A850C402_9ACTN|nr:hypothetical protein [Glycomyces artemisiae]